MSTSFFKTVPILIVILIIASNPLKAQSDQMNLEDNIGATVEDAYPYSLRKS